MIVRLLIIFLFTISVATVNAATSIIDVVYLTNGRVIEGEIIEFEPDNFLTIKTADRVIHHFPMIQVLRTAKEEVQLAIPIPEPEFKREPAVSALLSLVVPGLGQVYNGEYTSGGIYFVSVNSFNLVGSLMIQHAGTKFGRALGYGFFGAGIGMWLTSIIYAHMSAEEINIKNGFVKEVSFTPTVLQDQQLHTTNAAPGLSLTLKF